MQQGTRIGRHGRKPAEVIVIDELENGPGTFSELKSRTRLAYSTLAAHLKALEDKKDIEREYDAKRRKLLIKLSDKIASPREKTLRHLEALSPHKLDIGDGRELLTDEFLDVIFYKHFNEGKRKIGEFGVKLNENKIETEFNEYYLLKVIANFNCELRFAEEINKGENIVSRMIEPELTKILKKKIGNPELFPTLGEARRIGALKQFEALLAWISPLLEPHEDAEMRKTSPEWREMAGKHLRVLSPWNLAASVFMAEERDYLKKVLTPIWREKLRLSLRGKKKPTRKKGRKK